MKIATQAHIALILVNIIYGANYVIAKEATPEYILPFGFIVIRVSVCAILFSLMHYAFVREKVEPKDFPKLLVGAFFGVVCNQLMFFKGLSMTSPINASLIMITTPILVLIISAIVLKEGLTSRKILGIVLGAVGAFLIITFGQRFSIGGSNSLGDLFIFINAASYAIYLVYIKPLMQKYHPITIIKWVFVFGCIGVWPIGYHELMLVDWAALPNPIWGVLFYVVFFSTFLAYSLNISALKIVNPSVVGIYIYTQPVIATFIAVGLGKDSIGGFKIMAAILIFTGVYLVSFKKNEITLESDL